MDPRDRFTVYLAGQFVAVSVLWVAIGNLLDQAWLGRTGIVLPTTVGWVAARFVDGIVRLVLVGYLAAVAVVVWYGRRLDDRRLYVLVTTVAVTGIPGLALLAAAGSVFSPLFTLAVVLVGTPLLTDGVVWALGWSGPADTAIRDTSWFQDAATRWVIALVVAGLLVGSVTVASSGVLTHREETRYQPYVSFEFEYEPVNGTHGVLTVRHAGGKPAPREHLHVTGTGIAGVEGVDQSRNGVWAGEASVKRSGAAFVQDDDELTVGVTSDCYVAIVYRRVDSEVELGNWQFERTNYPETLNEATCRSLDS